MIKHNQNGAVSGLAVGFILCLLLLVGAIIFAAWAFSSRQDYKNNVDAKINTAVNTAIKVEDTNKDNYYAAQAKLPLTTFTGPSQYGSIHLMYPKTWSAYVDETGTGNALLDGFFNPGFVPSISSQTSQFALRVQVVSQSYSDTLQNFSSQEQQGSVSASAYALPSLTSVVGVKLSGQLNSGNSEVETMVILPLRSETLKIWTQGNQYINDFNSNILAHFSFSP